LKLSPAEADADADMIIAPADTNAFAFSDPIGDQGRELNGGK